MPAQRPRASFDPISPHFDLCALVEETPSFTYVDRISCDMIDQQGMDAFDKLVLLHVIIGGKPLVIDGYQSRLDPWTFSPKWLQDNVGDRVESARNITKNEPLPLTIAHYLKNMSKLTDQYFEKPDNYKEKERQRVYLKDIDCPDVWWDKLKEALPPNLVYLNENTGDVGGPGAADETIPTGGKRKGRGIAPAGDLMSSLPASMRAMNLMCYIGHEGTYTPAHKEMCGSLGQNIMVEASDIVDEDGKPAHQGSSIWFMTESKDRHSVQEYWLSVLGHDIEVENHFAQVAAWKKAPFTTYVVEQRPGDFILIPPLAPHQVWNRGTRTMKVAWNRTTVETLEFATKEALPNAKLVCRDEQYKNKAIIYYTLQKYSSLLARAKDQEQTASSPQEAAVIRTSPKIRQLQKDFRKLFHLFKDVMLSEMFAPESHEKNVQFAPFDSNITCAYCRGNIFNRFLTCPTCDVALGTTEPEPYDVCMECYSMGRSCGCISKLKWTEQFKWKELANKYEQWRRQYLETEKKPRADSPLPLAEERQRYEKKTLAQICQDQLKKRPWVDINKPQQEEDDEEEEIEVNDDGTVKNTKKRRSEAWKNARHACHVCQHRHEKWKMAECGCKRWWCYGSLFRAHDLMPQDVMADANWKCPHCLGICGAGSCRKDPRQTPYTPKGTLLGHDTRKVADARSVESLVDFSVSNLTWLKETSKDAPADNARLLERQQEADQAKLAMSMIEDPLVSDAEDDNHIHYDKSVIDPLLDDSIINPALGGTSSAYPRLPAVPQMPDGASNDEAYPCYAPAMHNGLVAPSAVMFQDASIAQDSYADFDDHERSQLTNKRKRASDDDEILRVPARKRVRPEDRDTAVPVSGATKQYRKEQERKALEEARKQGRFIQVHAALKGKSKLVKLPLPSDIIARLQSSPHTRNRHPVVSAAAQQASGGNDLLRSDLAPHPQALAAVPKTTDKQLKQVRVRVEPDDDFRGGRRRRDRKSTGKDANKKNIEYEELEIDSDVDEAEVEEEEDTEVMPRSSNGRSGRRRVSAWQAQRADEDDEDIPDELPENWKDGRKVQQTKGTPTTSRTTRLSTGGKSVSRLQPVPTDANRLAKMAAAGLANAEDDDDDYDDVDDITHEATPAPLVKRVASTMPEESFVKPVAMAGSILIRNGGKPVKIVSGAARKRQSGGA